MIGGYIGKAIGGTLATVEVIAATASASGAGVANGVGAGVIPATATASGLGAVSGVGEKIGSTTGTAAGLGAASGSATSLLIVSVQGTAPGAGVASADGRHIKLAAATASGLGASNATAVGITNATASAAGVGAANAGGAKFGTTIATASGLGASNGVSRLVLTTQGSASGTGAVNGVGGLIAAMVGTAIGLGYADATGIGFTLSAMRPDGDSVTDGWTDQAGGTSSIFQAIDEASVSDADYVQSPALIADAMTIKVRLYDGTTQIAEWTHTDIADTFTDAEQTLTAPQVAAITSFNSLVAELDDNAGNVYRFPLGDPPGDVLPPVKIKYRYKKMAA